LDVTQHWLVLGYWHIRTTCYSSNPRILGLLGPRI